MTFRIPPGGKTRRLGWFWAWPSPSSLVAASTAPMTTSMSSTCATSASRRCSAIADTIARVKRLNIGLIGLGTVGGQVAQRLLTRRDKLRRSAGAELRLCRVLVRDPVKKRAVAVPKELITTDPDLLLDGEDIDVVVELAGGEEPARTF